MLGLNGKIGLGAVKPKGSAVAAQYMETALYTGNGTSQTVNMAEITTGVDFAWIKNRNDAANHKLFDSVRGSTKVLRTDTVDAEQTDATTLTAFGDSSFDVGSNSGVNRNTYNIVAWCFSLPTDQTNTDGTITSTVKTNGWMSAISYGSISGDQTVGHSLDTAAELVITKSRGAASNWFVATNVIDGSDDYLLLEKTDAKVDTTASWSVAASATTFSVSTSTITSTNTISYAFTSKEGVCKVGTYTGTGGVNTITTDFEPRFVLVKRTSGIGDWVLIDNLRDPVNNDLLYANKADAEVDQTVATWFNFDATGFSYNTPNTNYNGSGDTYIYLAIA